MAAIQLCVQWDMTMHMAAQGLCGGVTNKVLL